MKKKSMGSGWDDVRKELFTSEEINASNMRVAVINEFISARKEKGISQKELEKLSGVKQPVIARLETGNVSPQIDTLLKLLATVGKTLAVVPIEKELKKA
ncbi:MAG: helix-turn-helix transcriptional regulator [Lachnospiraceae bacterium]|nr:helix-turn-helix transcriptional regulator [Lachnospiraceae bacterium]